MKIFVVGRCLPEKKTGLVGGFEFAQAKELRKNGFNTSYLFCDTRSLKVLQRISMVQKNIENTLVFGMYMPIGGMPAFIYNKLKFWIFREVWKTAIKKEGVPDIVHFHFPIITANKYILKYLKAQNVKIVVTEHWSRVQNKKLSDNWKNIHNYIMDNADRVIAVSNQLKKSMNELSNNPREILVIPNMVSSCFTYEEDVYDKGYFEFVSIGRIVPMKNFDLLVQAFVKAFDCQKEIKLTIIGNGPELEKIKKQVVNLGAEDIITFKGLMENEKVACYLKHCDALVSASSCETFGVTWIEGWCSGLPVIGVSNNSISEYFSNVNSVSFCDRDIESLSDALRKVFYNRKSYKKSEIAKKALEEFSGKAVVKKLNEVYQSLL